MAPPGSGNSIERGVVIKNEKKVAQNVMVIDGGFASQLGCHVQEAIDGDVLWSARFLATDPKAVVATHLDFLRAGADLIMTNTYQASVNGFMEHLKLSKSESYNLIKEAVKLAKTACDRFAEEYPETTRPRPLIAGSVGPYGASLHDASEYTGSYAKNTSVDVMREWHRPRIEALVEAGVDILALETIPCRTEAEMLVDLIKEFPNTKAWLCFSCHQNGKSIANGENFQNTARHCYDQNPQQLVGVGVNCLAPRLVESLLSGINKGRDKNPIPLVAYPNSGESYNVEMGWMDRDKCEPVASYVNKWLDLGITWIGGCCRTYAADISTIKNEVAKWQHAHNLGQEKFIVNNHQNTNIDDTELKKENGHI